MIWPCNGQVFFNEIDCYIYIYFYLFTHVTESFVTERLVTESWGLLLAPPPYFSVSCLKRFPDTPRIYTMVLQGFISIVSLSPLLSNLHRRILRSAIIACALQNQQMRCVYFCSYFCWRRLPGHYQPLHSLEFVYTVFWGTVSPHLRTIFWGITHLQGRGFKYFFLNFHRENWGRFPI